MLLRLLFDDPVVVLFLHGLDWDRQRKGAIIPARCLPFRAVREALQSPHTGLLQRVKIRLP
jgi:hypothetical protein